MCNTERIAELFTAEPLDYLGCWSKEKYRVDLYDVPNTPAMLLKITQAVRTVTHKFTLKVQWPLLPCSNVYIMDIDL